LQAQNCGSQLSKHYTKCKRNYRNTHGNVQQVYKYRQTRQALRNKLDYYVVGAGLSDSTTAQDDIL
jgi:hypothetical protein